MKYIFGKILKRYFSIFLYSTNIIFLYQNLETSAVMKEHGLSSELSLKPELKGTPFWRGNNIYKIDVLPTRLEGYSLLQFPAKYIHDAEISIVTENRSDVFVAYKYDVKDAWIKRDDEETLNRSSGTEMKWNMLWNEDADNEPERVQTEREGFDLDIIWHKTTSSGETIQLPVLTKKLRGARLVKEG